jgi:hypothetical protein
VWSVVDEVDIDIHAIACCGCTNNRANAHCSAATTTNDATKVAFTNANFKNDFVSVSYAFDAYCVWVVNN